MNAADATVAVIFTAAAALYVAGRATLDLAALTALAGFALAGVITPEEVLSGFGSPAALTMAATFFVTSALRRTGVSDLVGAALHRACGTSEARSVACVTAVAATVSSVMNNVAAAAVLMPAVVSLSYHSGVPASRLLMPLSFGTLLGGTLTLPGNTGNLLASDALRAGGLGPFTFLEFFPFGAAFVAVGVVYFVLWGRHRLPRASPSGSGRSGRELPALYRLHERLFTVTIEGGSSWDGRTVGELPIGRELGASVVSVVRGRSRLPVVGRDFVVRAGDSLLVRGRGEQLRAPERFAGLETEEYRGDALGIFSLRAAAVRLARPDPSRDGLASLALRERFGVVVLAVERDGRLERRRLAGLVLRPDDVLHVVAPEARWHDIDASGVFVPARSRCGAPAGPYVALSVPPGSPLVGRTVRESGLGAAADVSILGVRRPDGRAIAAHPEETIGAGDVLVAAGDVARLSLLVDVRGVTVRDSSGGDAGLEAGGSGVVEVVLSPRSSLVGRTVEETRFRGRYGLEILSVLRGGVPIAHDLARETFRFGDALLLHGPARAAARLVDDPNFVVFSDLKDASFRPRGATVAVVGLLLFTVPPALGLLPVHVSALLAAAWVGVGGAVTTESAYRDVEWRLVALVAAVLPVGHALARTGPAQAVTAGLTDAAPALGTYGAVFVVAVAASVVSQFVDNTVAVVLLVPAVVEAGAALGLDPHALPMAVTLGASLCFLFPFSHRANLLTAAAGGYRTADYLRVGTPLTLVLLAVLTAAIPLVYGGATVAPVVPTGY